MWFVSTYGAVAFLVSLATYRLYRAALPEPIPGIPNNANPFDILSDIPMYPQRNFSPKECLSGSRDGTRDQSIDHT